jgi:hypothetical protein
VYPKENRTLACALQIPVNKERDKKGEKLYSAKRKISAENALLMNSDKLDTRNQQEKSYVSTEISLTRTIKKTDTDIPPLPGNQ